MVGMMGSSNSPISGLLFIAVIILSLVFKGLSGTCHGVNSLLALVILMVGFIGFSATITNDNIQDYKSGQLVGATPYKQQISLFIGVLCSILVAPLMMNLIFHAYGIAGVPATRPGLDPNNMLNAPQASSIAMIAQHIIQGSQDWNLMVLGMIIGAVALVIDFFGKKTGKFRASGVMVGVGLYLPPDLVSGLFVGGLLSLIIKRRQAKLKATIGEAAVHKLENKANILVCGLIAGESLMGLILAVPFVLKQSSNALRIVGGGFHDTAQMLSFIVTIGLFLYIYRIATKNK